MERNPDGREEKERRMRLIDADALWKDITTNIEYCADILEIIEKQPTIEPERKKDIVQKFHDYQVEWLKSHYNIVLEPQLEEMIIRFLHDTANSYMMEEQE